MNPEIFGSPKAAPVSGSKNNLSRRELLALTGTIAASYFLGGCGGGGGGGAGGGTGAGLTRTVVAGDIKNQLNQFSLASEEIGNIWEGSSPALTNFQVFATGGNRSRAVSDTKLMLQATWYSLQGLKAGYERLLNGYLAEDDQGYVGQTVSTNNSLSATSTLVNPQWLAAMMLQTYCAARVVGALMKIIQVGGIKPMQDWVKAQPTDLEKLIAYAILADTYNSWLDTLATTLGISPLTAAKLDVSNTVTAAQVAAKVDAMDAIIETLPFTPGMRAGGNANGIPDDALLTGPETANFALSFLGTLAKITLTTGTVPATFPQTVDPSAATYNLSTRMGKTGLAATIAALDITASAPAKATILIQQLMATGLPASDGSAASCHVQMAVGGYDVVVAVAQAVLSEHSIVGAALDGANALNLLNGEITVMGTCGSSVQTAILDSVLCDILYLRSSYLVGGSTYVLRTIPTTNIPGSTETDQVRGLLQINCQNVLCYPLANAGWTATVTARLVPLFRQVVAGLPSASASKKVRCGYRPCQGEKLSPGEVVLGA